MAVPHPPSPSASLYRTCFTDPFIWQTSCERGRVKETVTLFSRIHNVNHLRECNGRLSNICRQYNSSAAWRDRRENIVVSVPAQGMELEYSKLFLVMDI